MYGFSPSPDITKTCQQEEFSFNKIYNSFYVKSTGLLLYTDSIYSFTNSKHGDPCCTGISG